MSDRHAGFLTVSLVKAGEVDTWARFLPSGERVIVKLRYDKVRDRFIVAEKIDDGVNWSTTESAHRFLSDAHTAFTALTLKHR